MVLECIWTVFMFGMNLAVFGICCIRLVLTFQRDPPQALCECMPSWHMEWKRINVLWHVEWKRIVCTWITPFQLLAFVLCALHLPVSYNHLHWHSHKHFVWSVVEAFCRRKNVLISVAALLRTLPKC